MVMSKEQASHQDIRPLKIALLNLMPKKIQTETQFARLIGATPLQIEFSLIRMSDHESRNTAAEHMEEFYRPFRAVRDEKFDGLIITGAPIEHLPFEEVSYWPELTEVFDWTQTIACHLRRPLHAGAAWRCCTISTVPLVRKTPCWITSCSACYRHMNFAPEKPLPEGFFRRFPVSCRSAAGNRKMRRPEIEAAGLSGSCLRIRRGRPGPGFEDSGAFGRCHCLQPPGYIDSGTAERGGIPARPDRPNQVGRRRVIGCRSITFRRRTRRGAAEPLAQPFAHLLYWQLVISVNLLDPPLDMTQIGECAAAPICRRR